jgi:predicted ATPase/DNA-binding winged helix-turn-helix (wHTH) protein
MRFDRFQVFPETREFVFDGLSVPLGGRAFDLVQLLVEAQGGLVEKDEIMRRVWNGVIVEENSLQVAVSALRKALGSQSWQIKTVSRRGYQLVSSARPSPLGGANNLPLPTTDLIGRTVALHKVSSIIRTRRLVTLTGAGGIGKTRLGLEIARRLLPEFTDGAWLIDFGAITNSALVLREIANALKLEIADGIVTPDRIAKLLAPKTALILLDNCEHVIEVVAGFVEAVTQTAPNTAILATSREPIGARGEVLYRLSGLSAPEPNSLDLSTANLSLYSAIELFITRVREIEDAFPLNEKDLVDIAAICRRLDGLPLAIELTAARAVTLGIEELAARLDDQFKPVMGGFRTALPRHQTLQATFDWSFNLLSEAEQSALCSLGIFVGPFALTAAVSVIATNGLSSAVDCITGLTAKSLVVSEKRDGKLYYRLLETTRSYALLKLRENGNFDVVARRHAEFCRDLLKGGERDVLGGTKPKNLPQADMSVANIEGALEWSFCSTGDPVIGIDLVIAAAPTMMYLSMTNEYLQHVHRALAIAAKNNTKVDAQQELELYAALGLALVSTHAPGAEVRRAFTKALMLAEQTNDANHRLRALWGLCNAALNEADFITSLNIAEKYCYFAAVSGDESALASGRLLLGASLHLNGRSAEAREQLGTIISGPATFDDEPSSARFLFNRRAIALSLLSADLWKSGFPDQARQRAHDSVEEAISKNHALSLCTSLSNAACPTALFRGDLAEAEHFLNMLESCSNKYDLGYYKIWAECFRGVLLSRQGDLNTGLKLMRRGLAKVSDRAGDGRFAQLRARFAEALGRAGDFAEAFSVVDPVIAVAPQFGRLVTLPMFMRIKGELIRLENGDSAPARAEIWIRRALDCAHKQEARGFELQAAMSLASLAQAQGGPTEAFELLKQVHARFTEGFETADLVAAARLLQNRC